MILVDTSVWIDHLQRGNAVLAELLNAGRVLTHPFVIGELALGHLRQRAVILGALAALPRAEVAQEAEVLHFIDLKILFGRGVKAGWLDPPPRGSNNGRARQAYKVRPQVRQKTRH